MFRTSRLLRHHLQVIYVLMPVASGVLSGMAAICLRITSLMKDPQQQQQQQQQSQPGERHGSALHHHGRDKQPQQQQQQQHSEHQQQALVPWQRVRLMQLAATVIDMANRCMWGWVKDMISLYGPLLHALAGLAVAMMQEAKAAAATGQLPHQLAELHGISAAAAARAGVTALKTATFNSAPTLLAASTASTRVVRSENVLHVLIVHLAAMVACLQEKQHSGRAAASGIKGSSSTTSSTSSGTSSSSVSSSNQQCIAPAPHQQLLAAAGLQVKHVTSHWHSSAPQDLAGEALNDTVVVCAALQHILEQLPVHPATAGSGQDCQAHGKLVDEYLPPQLLQALLLVLAEFASLCTSTFPLCNSARVLSYMLQAMGKCQQLLAATSKPAHLSGPHRIGDSTADKVGLHDCCGPDVEAQFHSGAE
jgi:hypothetical protein